MVVTFNSPDIVTLSSDTIKSLFTTLTSFLRISLIGGYSSGTSKVSLTV